MATNPDPPVYALGMDMYVPNDCVQLKPDWAALTRWVVGATVAEGGMPKGVSGEIVVDALPATLVLGRRKAAAAQPGDMINYRFEDCIALGAGGTKDVTAKRISRGKKTLTWSRAISSSYRLAITSTGRLVHFGRFGDFTDVDLTQIGYPPDDPPHVPPNPPTPHPPIQILTFAPAGNNEAYLLAKIGTGTPDTELYRYYKGKLSMVGFDPGYNFSFTGYTIYEYDFYTGYNGSILFRAYAMSGTLEHIAAQGDLARVVNFSANSLSTGHRMFHPVQIDSDSTLSVRYGLDRQIPGSVVPTYNKQSILSVTVGTVSTDVASLPIYDEPFIRQSNVIAIGQGIAIVAMPKLWPIAVQPDIGYNVGFTFNNPYSYWGNEYPIDGFTIFDRYQDVFVASRYGAVPLLSGVDYNRTITVIPTGGGTALIFCVRRAVFSAPMQPEVYFFDGYEVAKFPNSDLWPDVYGYCVADGIAVFCTGQTDTAAPPAWCIFRSDLLTIRGLGLDPYISPTVGVSSARTWAHIEKVGSFTGRTYKIGDGSLYKSVVMMFFPDEHVEEADISVDGVWQLVASSVPVSNGALLIAYALEHEVPTYYHFFYLGIAKTDGDGRIVVNYVGRVTNTSGGFQLPTALRVSKGAVALQMDYAYDVEAVGFRPMPLETFYVSSGSEGKPIVSKGKHPKNWVGDLAQVGDSFVMFPPSEIVDLRPPVLASRGEL